MEARIWITTKKGVMVTCKRATKVPCGDYTVPLSEDVISLVEEIGKVYVFLLSDEIVRVIVNRNSH